MTRKNIVFTGEKMMKRKLIAALCFSLFVSAAPAMADMYEMTSDVAINLRDVSWSDTTGGGFNFIKYIGYNPGTTAADKVYGGAPTYGVTMYYDVGFVGDLTDLDSDGVASVDIGASGNTNGVLTTLKGLGSFDSYGLYVSNDNSETWQYRLYADFGSGQETSSWTSLDSGERAFLTLDFSGGSQNFSSLDDIGFAIKATTGSDTFHTSVVPTPAAVLLCVLGLGAVGIKLRKFA